MSHDHYIPDAMDRDQAEQGAAEAYEELQWKWREREAEARMESDREDEDQRLMRILRAVYRMEGMDDDSFHLLCRRCGIDALDVT